MRYVVFFILGVVISSCSDNIIVHTDFDRSVEVHRLANYSWLGAKNIEERNHPLYINELNDTEELVNKAVQKIFQSFPISAAYEQSIK